MSFCDVLGAEDWALDMVPAGATGVVFLFPIKDVTEEHKEAQAAEIIANGQVVSENVYYMKQIVGNACGTVGLLHAMANAPNAPIAEGSWLDRFYARTRGATAQSIGEALEADDEIEECHEEGANQGQSAQVELEEPVNTHFVALSVVDGHLYELDGRKQFAINHGPCESDELLRKSVLEVVRSFMDRDPEELRFTILALAPTQNED